MWAGSLLVVLVLVVRIGHLEATRQARSWATGSCILLCLSSSKMFLCLRREKAGAGAKCNSQCVLNHVSFCRAAVLAQREREKELKRLEEEAALEKIRRENFEARKAAAAAAAAPPPVIHVDLKSGAEGGESKEVKGDSIEGVMVYTSQAQGAVVGEGDDGDDVIKTEQLDGGEPHP